MKKLFLLIPVLAFTLMTNATAPTITIDGDKSDWAEVPMLTEPGTWPMLKVLPAADAELGTNALVYMMENTADFDPSWTQYPTEFIDKDYDKSTEAIAEYWGFSAMGVDYKATTGVQVGEDWISFPKAMSANSKVFEIGFPDTYITDLGSKFGFAMYFNSGAWFCPDRSTPAKESFSPANGFLYKTRSFTTVAGTTNLTTANVYAHPSMGEVGEYVDFGLRDNGYDTLRWAAFPIELTAPAVYDVTTNVTTTSSYKFEFWLVDVASNAVVAHIPAPESSVSSSKTTYTFGSLDLRAVPAGKYMLKVMNKKAFAKVQLNSIDLTYAGGAVVNVPGTLNINDAVITNGKRQDGVIKFDNALTGIAEWNIAVASSAALDVALTIKNQYGHNLSVSVYEEDGVTPVDAVSEGGDKYTSDVDGLVIELGGIYLAAGNYVVKVTNATSGSDAKIASLALTYLGGAVQNMPGTTAINDAWFSANGTRADGKISFPGSTIQDGWVKWNVSFASAATYKVNLNLNSGNGKDMTVALQDADGNNVVAPLNKNGGAQGTPVSLEMGEMNVPAGNYILKVTNATQWSDAEVISVQFVYEGGAVVNIPAEELVGQEAVLVDAGHKKVSKLANGDLQYGDNSNPLGEYVYWNIHATKSGRMNVTANIAVPGEGDPSGHNFLVELFADLNEAALATTAEPSQTDATGARALPAIEIPAAGDYIVKLTNQTQWSSAILHSLEFEYVCGDRATLPATFDFADAILSAKAHVTAGELWFNEIGDSNPVGQWAKWNVKVAATGTFLFTLNTNASAGQSYKISILDELENEIDAFESASLGSGDKTVKAYFNLAAGNYIVKLENTYPWSQGHIISLVVTQPSLLVLDEAAETNAVITANYRIDAQDIQITRTIVADMYNTICLPFDVSDAQLKAIFGSDVELLQMSSAEMNGDELDLIFEEATTGIYRGTPYLIKTSSNVVNPIFTDAVIKTKEAASTSGTAADFIGTLIKSEVPAGENNLFLGPNDLLYFSDAATPIKGMRAWFQVKVPSLVIKRANIVNRTDVTTNIETVNSQESVKSHKLLRDGQLIIVRDGVQYNAFGVKVK